MKFVRLIFLLGVSTGWMPSITPASAQLKIDDKVPPAELLIAPEINPPPPKTELPAAYIPEPETYGLAGAACLGLLLAFRRVLIRSSALPG